MGTKLQYTVNPLATSPNNNSFVANRLDDWDDWDYFQNKGLKENSQRTGLEKLPDSMDRIREQQSIESIKKTMLMQEEIFKHQVLELHRLYSVQKLLMEELKREIKKTRFWSSMTGSDYNHSHYVDRHHPTTQIPCGFNLHVQSVRDDPSSRERSGSCSGDTLRMPRSFDLERPAEEDISTGVSAIEEDQSGPSTHRSLKNTKMNIDGSDEESKVELTLSIGGSTSKKRTKNHQPHCSLELGCSNSARNEIRELGSSSSIKSDQGEECSDPTNTMISSSATFDRERKRPHWLFQGLSLNRT